MHRPLTFIALASLVLACSGPARPPETPPPAPPPPPVAEPMSVTEEPGLIVPEESSAPEGPACMRTTDCESGLACRGAGGCASDWACGAPRECGTERVGYCDCEGVTFYAQSGCPGRAYAHVGPCADASVEETSLGMPDGDEPITSEDRTCESTSDCRRWQVCFGPAGCGGGWRCERVRGCSRQRVAFCGCDGETFMASPDCPGRAFFRRGACDEALASVTPDETRPAPTSTPPAVTATTRPSEPAVVIAPAPAPTGCASSRDCRGGRVCTGPPGCGMAWTCERPPAPCNPDTQVFCDCEGETFRASMTCPGRPHAHRGSCAMDQMLDLSGAALR